MKQQPVNITDLGYPSWLACYDDMVHENLQDEPTIELTWPDSATVSLKMDRIKSGAFDEVFPLLPTAAAMQVMLAMIEDDASIKQRQVLLEFLNKIPTRAE